MQVAVVLVDITQGLSYSTGSRHTPCYVHDCVFRKTAHFSPSYLMLKDISHKHCGYSVEFITYMWQLKGTTYTSVRIISDIATCSYCRQYSSGIILSNM